MRKYLLDCRCS